MVQIWESMVSSGPQKEVIGQGEQQASIWEQCHASHCTHSPHCKPLNLRSTFRIGVTGTYCALGASRLAWEPWILGFFFSFTGKVPGTFLLLLLRAPVKGLYRVSF